jgi:hypothetical protein
MYYVGTHIDDPQSSTYGLSLEKRIFDNILYEADSSDIPR